MNVKRYEVVYQGASSGKRIYKDTHTNRTSPLLKSGVELLRWINNPEWTPELEGFDPQI